MNWVCQKCGVRLGVGYFAYLHVTRFEGHSVILEAFLKAQLPR